MTHDGSNGESPQIQTGPDAESEYSAKHEILFCVLLEEHCVPIAQGNFMPTRMEVTGGRVKMYGKKMFTRQI